MNVKTPMPIGLLSKAAWEVQMRNQRIDDLVDAIRRYKEARLAIPQEWLDELREV